ncbi:MAG TPA: ribosome biogenesis GTPase Der [Geminicoccaceae bacterium]|nr:ribosome biogenesis GTPase Der [Geminicoccaceae bacterium]
MSLTVAIVGRPNVGKSTLFNRLVGRREALVDPTPGVTRDRIQGNGRIGPLAFTAIDTAGLAEGPEASLEGRLRQQTGAALAEADLALMLIDAKAGLTALDRHFARWLRRQSKPVILVANKCEGQAAASFASEAWALGLGAPVPISAQNGEGLADLADAIATASAAADRGAPDGSAPTDSDRPLRLVVAGRPNVGKSSLINRLLEDERLLTGPEPGLTRDAVSVVWQWRGRRIELVDTAGLRRRARIERGGLEELSSRAALAALRRAEVVLLLVDATTPLDKQDLTIANRALEAGRALVVAANKWDLVAEPKAALALLRDRIAARLPQVKGVACLPISVLTGKNLPRLLPAVVEAHERWSRRVATAALNRWLEEAVAAHPPPMAKGRRVKIRYATQVAAQPPTFVLFVSQADALPESYLRYLAHGLRETFDLAGVPLRLLQRTGDNPYV